MCFEASQFGGCNCPAVKRVYSMQLQRRTNLYVFAKQAPLANLLHSRALQCRTMGDWYYYFKLRERESAGAYTYIYFIITVRKEQHSFCLPQTLRSWCTSTHDGVTKVNVVASLTLEKSSLHDVIDTVLFTSYPKCLRKKRKSKGWKKESGVSNSPCTGELRGRIYFTSI